MHPDDKWCQDCLQRKPISLFNKHSSEPSGLYSYCRDCHRERARAYSQTEMGKRNHRKTGGEWEKRNHIKKNAHSAVRNALKSGRLNKKPCVFCGVTESYAHHPDYTKKLDVIWVCSNHHADIHAGRIDLDFHDCGLESKGFCVCTEMDFDIDGDLIDKLWTEHKDDSAVL